jgi:hypothetical protein
VRVCGVPAKYVEGVSPTAVAIPTGVMNLAVIDLSHWSKGDILFGSRIY